MKKEVKAICLYITFNPNSFFCSQSITEANEVWNIISLGLYFKAGMNNFSHELSFQEEAEIFIYQHSVFPVSYTI